MESLEKKLESLKVKRNRELMLQPFNQISQLSPQLMNLGIKYSKSICSKQDFDDLCDRIDFLRNEIKVLRKEISDEWKDY